MGAGALEALLSLLFPPRCPACGRYVETRGGWCDPCLHAAIRVRRLALTPMQRSVLAAAWTLGSYEGALRDLVRALKYQGRTEHLRAIGTFLRAAAPAFRHLLREDWGGSGAQPLGAYFDVAAAVPLHAARERQRGFNQTERIFSAWLAGEGLAMERLLARVRKTRPQYGLSREERAANLKDAFSPAAGAAIRGRCVLLLDDIFTTGTTAAHCAAVLRAAGAARVAVLTLASGQGTE